MAKTQPRRAERAGTRAGERTGDAHPPNRLLTSLLLGGAALVAAGLVARFPNLRGQPAYLALVVLTPLLLGATAALVLSGLRRRIPRFASLALGGALALVMILDLVAFAGPLVTSGPTGQATTPTFVEGATAPPTVIDATATAGPGPRAAVARSGQFDARPGADTVSGQAALGQTSDGKLVLSLHALHAANGPDLYVYLAQVAAPTTSEQVMRGYEVGKLTATTGTVNYELPTTLDVTGYQSVVVYCKSFSVIFGYAHLT
jgi:Electron transfer DM13